MLILAALAIAAPPGALPAGVDGRPVLGISVTFEHADLGGALRLLAEYGNANIVLPDDVRGQVDLRLKNVTLDEAFAALLMQKGLVAVATGPNVLVVRAQDHH